MELKRTCPECNLVFEASPTRSGVLTCPLCDTVFSVEALTGTASQAPPHEPMPTTSGRHVLKGCMAVGALIALVGGLAYAYHLAGGVEQKATSTSPPSPQSSSAAPPSEPPPVIEVLPVHPTPPPPQPVTRAPSLPPPSLPRPVTKPSEPMSLAERINHAIDRGVAYLQKNHSGHDQYRNYLGLLGLTLLECGVAEKDPTVRQIAAWLRTREHDLVSTYELSLAILFLDRLNDPQDRPLIRTFGQRLLDGQLEGGTWTYSCPSHDKHRRPAGRKNPAPPSRAPQGPQIISWKNAAPLGKPAMRLPVAFRGDNSNTQFALLGLWVAQRHGVSARRALLATEQYYRQTQLKDGSWSYHPHLVAFRDSMTCAGLMSLAMRHGVISGQGRDIRPDQPAEVHDKAVTQGLHFLGLSSNKVVLARGRITGVEARDPLYFLWSLERMAMIYDLRTIGDKDWYPWAASLLIQNQQADGSWSAPYPSPVGTCFALLVLRRSNIAHDLQLSVQGQPRRPGPGQPTIIQGPEAALGSTTTPKRSPGMSGTGVNGRTPEPLGSTTIPRAKPDP